MLTENIIVKDWRNIDVSFGLIYPNIYRIGMSSYTVRLLYYLINSYDNIACERIFLPEKRIKYPASEDYLPKDILRSHENKILPKDFDILGFSLHFENDVKNILWILEKAGIPLTFEERQKSILENDVGYPLIIGGGPVVKSNPMPLSKIFDLFFIGDAEPNLKLFFKLFLTYNKNKIAFQEFLNKASQINGIFVPSFSNKVKRVILKDLDVSPIPIFQLISNPSEPRQIFEKNFFIEVNRGCPYQCKFCISSFHNAPYRNRSYENIIQAIDEGMKYTNFETISLIGSCVSSHPKFKQICKYIIDRNKRLTLPSIRIEHITPELIQILEEGNIKTITIAPESGSENLRYTLGKLISNEKIISVASQIHDSRIKNIKFYFLIGLPNETESDIHEIVDLLKLIDKIGFGFNSLRVNINPFIPKLNTPYEKEIAFYFKDKIHELNLKYKLLEKELKSLRSIRIKFKDFRTIIKNARLQTMISLGDNIVSDLLLTYYRNGANFGALKRAEKDLGFSLDDYLLKIRECYSPWQI